MRRCGEREFHDSLLKTTSVFVLVISDGIILHEHCSGKKLKDHCIDATPGSYELSMGSREGQQAWRWDDLNNVI